MRMKHRSLTTLPLFIALLACSDVTEPEPGPGSLRFAHLAPEVGTVRLVLGSGPAAALSYGAGIMFDSLDPGPWAFRLDGVGAVPVPDTVEIGESTDHIFALTSPAGLLELRHERLSASPTLGHLLVLNATENEELEFSFETANARAATTLAPGDTASVTIPAGEYVATITRPDVGGEQIGFPPFSLVGGAAVLAAVFALDGGLGFLAF